MHILGLLGKKGAGKDTAAKALFARGWKRIAFGDALYEELANAFGVPIELLQNRETKETPLARLALRNCKNKGFVHLVEWLEGYQAPNDQFLRKSRSPRELLQLWATEYRREQFSQDYWTNIVRQQMVQEPGAKWVVTDVRHRVEVDMLRGLSDNVTLVRVVRPASHPGVGTVSTDKHSSETEADSIPVSATLVNEEGRQMDIQYAVLRLVTDSL